MSEWREVQVYFIPQPICDPNSVTLNQAVDVITMKCKENDDKWGERRAEEEG